MKAETIDWGQNTPVYDGSHYNPFKSTYKNIRYTVKPMTNTYTVTSADIGRIPMISYKIYGSVNYWRAILAYNGLRNPITDIYPGQLLKLPDKDDLLAKLLDTEGVTSSNTNSENVVLTL